MDSITYYRSKHFVNGIHRKTGTAYAEDGYDVHGYDKDGFYLNEKYSKDGYDRSGHDKRGFNRNGIHKKTNGLFAPDGFDRSNRDREGFNREGFNLDGINRGGFYRDGFNAKGFDCNGFGRDGYDLEGYDRSGYNNNGINRQGFISPSKWQEIILSITQTPHCQNEWYAENSYSELNDNDIELARGWANAEKDNDHTMARMLSARTAEKIAEKFYRALGFEINDVSIKQLDKESINLSNDWKSYDLLLNNKISIDVKNARTPLNSKVTYVEHCVSRFKNNRNNQNVVIVGVLSPYLKLDDIQNPDRINHDAIIKFLGETTISDLNKLEERFSKRLLKVSLKAMNFIPRWAFEFPEKFYEARKHNSFLLQQVTLELMPTIELCRQNGINPLPAYLSSGFSLPDAWKTGLNDWQIDFYSRIRPRDNAVVTMPVLFLALLTHFLEAVTKKKDAWNEYNPDEYRQLLYSYSSVDEDQQMPLGIFDPLGTIKSFIETLSVLWSNREHTNLDEFELFKFNGVGLLEGKRLTKQKYETILAYCGGFVDGKGKCGNTPLILGKHESCPECGKLICEKCGHCSTNCLLCDGRMKKLSNASENHITEDANHDLTHYEDNPFDGDVPF